MATVCREIFESRGTLTKNNGKWRGQRTYQVYDAATAANFDAEDDVIAIFGTATSPDAMPTYSTAYPGISTLLAVTPNITRVEGHKYLWEVRWEYDQITFPPSGLNSNEVGYVEFNLDIGRSFFPAWRAGKEGGTDFSSPPSNLQGSSQLDIGGNMIDGGGQPGTAQRLQQILDFTEVMTGTTLASSLSTYRAFVGRRNSATFYGATAGRVVMLPIQTSRIDLNLFNVHFRFGWDEWFHLEQQARHDDLGNVVTVAGHAYPVLWIQPIPEVKDFTTISANW